MESDVMTTVDNDVMFVEDEMDFNWTVDAQELDEYHNPLDIAAIKMTFILLYCVVFVTCFIGQSI